MVEVVSNKNLEILKPFCFLRSNELVFLERWIFVGLDPTVETALTFWLPILEQSLTARAVNCEIHAKEEMMFLV